MDNYWKERTDARLLVSETLGVRAIADIDEIYSRSLSNIDAEIKSIYANYAKKGVLPISELNKALTSGEREAFQVKAIAKASELGINASQVYDERYLFRLTRLEALKEQIRLEILSLTELEESINRELYTDVVEGNYRAAQLGYAEVGILPSFTELDRTILNEILRSHWEGGYFSSRVWSNTGRLAVELPAIIGGGLLSGTSYQKTSQLLRERFGVSQYEAVRLVRTETNYFHNQSELQSMIDDDINYYEYDAVMDNRTSDVCEGLDGKVFKTTEAVVGKNYPPMHVLCRSSPNPILSGSEIGRDEDGNRISIRDRTSLQGGIATTQNRASRLSNGIENWKDRYRNSPVENAVVYDYNTGRQIARQTGTVDEIDFSERQWARVKGNFLMHNHPNDPKTSFSPTDVEIALRQGAYETIVVGNNGDYHMRFRKMTKKQRDLIADDVKIEFKKAISQYGDMDDELLYRNLWTGFAEKHGLKYWEKPYYATQ